MDVFWTDEARRCFSEIKSIHFTEVETKAYKKALVIKIRNKIMTIMESIPAKEPGWKGNYRVLVDSYKVYYSFSEDQRTCYIKGFKHKSQK